MNKNKLKQFVNALDELSDYVKNMDVDMFAIEEPLCGTPGCHAGLISIVAKDLPELQEIYENHIYFMSETEIFYKYFVWADTLADFLGFEKMRDLEDWAKENPKIWGNIFGGNMFKLTMAFTHSQFKKLTHIDIINHWKQVLVNIEA
jgi:hypothetical protein